MGGFTLNARKSIERWARRSLSEGAVQTWELRLLGLSQIPLVFFVGPRIIERNANRCVLEVRLNRRTRNHLKSMYFGALAVGAELAAGLLAKFIGDQRPGSHISIIFKDFHADFLKRVEADAQFICEDGAVIREAIDAALKTGERQNVTARVVAVAPRLSGGTPVAQFRLTLSLKTSSP